MQRRSVLRPSSKQTVDCGAHEASGRAFHRRGAAAPKALSPMVLSFAVCVHVVYMLANVCRLTNELKEVIMQEAERDLSDRVAVGVNTQVVVFVVVNIMLCDVAIPPSSVSPLSVSRQPRHAGLYSCCTACADLQPSGLGA